MNTPTMERLNITITKEIYEELKKQSENEKRSRSGHISWLIEKYSEIIECYYCLERKNCIKIDNLLNNHKK